MSGAFLTGVLLGLGAAVPIGPVNVEIARRAIRRTPWHGAAVGCGAATIDMACAVLTAFGGVPLLEPLLNHAFLQWPLLLTAAVVLLWLGVSNLLAARRAWRDGPSEKTESAAVGATGLWRGYAEGAAMTAVNPYTFLFWFTVVPATVAIGSPAAGAGGVGSPNHTFGGDLPMICTGVFIGTLSWVVCFTLLLATLKQFFGRRLIWIADAVGGSLLICFAVLTLWQSVRRLL